MWGGGEPEGQRDDDIDKAFFVEMVPLEAFVQVEGEGATELGCDVCNLCRKQVMVILDE